MMGPQLSLIVDIFTYLIPGIIVFIFIPSGIISYFEQWTFDESVYFAFVTLTTIGYGDYVAGKQIEYHLQKKKEKETRSFLFPPRLNHFVLLAYQCSSFVSRQKFRISMLLFFFYWSKNIERFSIWFFSFRLTANIRSNFSIKILKKKYHKKKKTILAFQDKPSTRTSGTTCTRCSWCFGSCSVLDICSWYWVSYREPWGRKRSNTCSWNGSSKPIRKSGTNSPKTWCTSDAYSTSRIC